MNAVEDLKDQKTGVVNTGYTQDEPKRRVSISSDAIQADVERQRKISSGSHQRKTVLHNGDHHHQHFVEPGYSGEGPQAKNKPDVSWWFLLCTKCRQKETGPGWEPPGWQSVCPYPFCPTYRHIARCIALILLVLLAWGIVFSVIGEDAAPGGQLFDIAMLVILAHLGGYVFRMANLPGLVGMLLVGILVQNVGLINIHGSYMRFCGILRRIALVIILTRAGLDLDPGAMRRLFGTTLKLGLVPWVAEAGVITISGHFFLGMPWMWALLMGSIFAAVSPAVVVPTLIRLRSKGYGVAKGIPTVVIAVSGIDDAASVAAFGIIQSLMFSEHSLLYNIALGPVSVIGGIGFGVLWGLLSKYIPEKGDPFVVPMRILMLLGGGLIAVFGSEEIKLEGAGPLGVVAAAFVSAWLWSTQGWDIEDNPVGTAFEIFWMVFEPILFSLTGTQIRINEINPNVFWIGFTSIFIAVFLRQIVTVLVAIGGQLNLKEKVFIALSWQAKASVQVVLYYRVKGELNQDRDVDQYGRDYSTTLGWNSTAIEGLLSQAALAPVALDTVRKLGMTDGPEKGYAEVLLMICVLSIAITAPLGAIMITLSGPRLLSKTIPGPPTEWRRGTRPSLRDITVIDEGNEADDIERRVPQRRKSIEPGHAPPNVVITHQPEHH